MAPSIGRVVIFRDTRTADPHRCWLPAMITRVYKPESVNLTVFPDLAPPVFRGSVLHATVAGDEDCCWDWPPRVE